MNLSLPPELERYIAEKVESGEYLSPDEVLVHGLSLLRERDEINRLRLEALRKEVDVGLEQLDRGEYTTHNEASLTELAEQIKTEGRRKLADKKQDANPRRR